MVLVQTTREAKSSHRGRLDIMANILTSAVGGVRKTSIMYKCNLSFRQLEVYVRFLLKKGLLRTFIKKQSAASLFFETTDQGMDFLRAYKNLDALMSV
jgi:predicted transcriptional regulator